MIAATAVSHLKGLSARVATTLLGLAVAVTPAFGSDSPQQTFASPQQAADALSAAVRANAADRLLAIFGPQGDKLVRSGDPIADRKARERFDGAYARTHKIVKESDGRAVLVIGKRAWPFPIPLVKTEGAWRFDTAAGEEEILDRRIGRNELDAIQVCDAYVQAQREYASVDRDGDGILEYASRFRSSPGRRDGLYWPVTENEPESPLGPLMASAQAEGYGVKRVAGHRREPYHGYYYRILMRQGGDAPGGAYDYVVNGQMIGGFALIAFPARYGASGIKTFIVNQDGVVYQKDLGADTAVIARRMAAFNPDKTWTKAVAGQQATGPK